MIAGVCFSHFFMCLAGGLALVRGVRNSEVSAMRESTVYVREIQACLLKKMLNVRYCLSVVVRENRAEAKRSRSAFDLHLFTIDIKAT